MKLLWLFFVIITESTCGSKQRKVPSSVLSVIDFKINGTDKVIKVPVRRSSGRSFNIFCYIWNEKNISFPM